EERVEVAYHAENDQWVVHKTYTLHQERYQIDLRIELEPKGQNIAATRARLFFAGPSVNEIADDSVTSFVLNETKDSLEKFETGKAENLAWHWGTPRAIIGAEDKYFVHTLVRDSTHFVQRAYVKTFDPKNTFPVLESAEIKEKKQWDLSFYFGPKVFDHLSDADDKLEDLLSFGWLSWLCKVLLKLLDYLFDLIGNYGLAIIVLTILLKLPFAPLSIYGRKRMEEYQRYQPTIQRIRAKYKHDMKMQHEELMKFHKDHNLSTSTPILGCLPLLIQMPILFALYRVLNSYLDLYQAPFVGWLIDLSSKDPYYVLPIAMGVSMIWQQKMTPMADEKQRVIMLFMAIVMTVVFANFPAGLVLYWLMNNLLTIAEDYVRKLFFS
ncbi:membrane protein insertase YidC, partial [Candidatus Dependentiae bacterium]|nr:membrane protein insertase YidC [Candidatus Dependentiae bacterium]